MANDSRTEQALFEEWARENLGEKTGVWYGPYLEEMGRLLEKFNLDKGNKFLENFFGYQTFEEFKSVYITITGQDDADIPEIIKGSVKRYPNTFNGVNLKFRDSYAQERFDKGERTSPNNVGGIPALGAMLRAYLKYLFYKENPDKTYPKKEHKTSTQEGKVDDSINYWLYAPGDEARKWDDFYESGVMGIGWDYLGDLVSYENRLEVENVIAEHRKDGIRPTNDSKAVWDFYQELKPGDIVYVKLGIKKIIGKGIVSGDYYYDDQVSEFKHRHQVNWTHKGYWELKDKVAMKTLSNINSFPELIVYMDALIEEEKIEDTTILINEFQTWLSQQVQSNGELLNDRTIKQKVSAIKDIEKFFEVNVFGELDTEALKDIKETVLADETYNKYKGVSSSSIDYYIRYIESRPSIEENDIYTREDFLSDVFIDDVQLKRLVSVLQNKKNLILKGAPGVGKTYIADRLAYLMMEEKDDSRIQMIQFHQSYSYEDFIEGYRPKADGDGFELKRGPFVTFARKAARDPERDYFFIIDEINRGNMSKIFGELMMLIETEKRGKLVNLLYSNEKFAVPSNLYIIGMMNTADRSLALLDYALRRRFAFFDIQPAFENLTFIDYITSVGKDSKIFDVVNLVKELNHEISTDLGKGFQIGHSYFVGAAFEVNADLRSKEVIEFEIIPQLYEYWFDNETKADEWANRLRGVYIGDEF